MFSNFPTIFFESRSLHASEEEVPNKPFFLDPTKSFVRKSGKDITLVGFGPSVIDALEVASKLKEIRNIYIIYKSFYQFILSMICCNFARLDMDIHSVLFRIITDVKQDWNCVKILKQSSNRTW